MKLPNAKQAFVDDEKLRNYCLNPSHSRGRNKARIFSALLGLTADQFAVLRDAILKAVLVEDARQGEGDSFGQRYIVDFQMTGPRKTVTVRTAWIVLRHEDFPRLTSCYIL